MTCPRHDPAAAAPALAALVSSALDGHAWLDAYRAWRERYHRGSEPHHPRAIAIATELARGHPRVSQVRVRALLGGNWAQMRAAQEAICGGLGISIPLQRHVNMDCAGASAALLDELRGDLGALPETCLDAHAPELYPAPRDRYAARVLALATPSLKLTAALHLLLVSADRMSGGRVTRQLQGWESLDRWAAAAGAGEQLACHARVPDATLAWLAAEPSQNRLNFWCLLAQSTRRLERYLRVHAEVDQRVGQRLARIPLPGEYAAARSLAQRIRVATVDRRAATADPLADDYPEVLELADVRFAEVAAVRDAFDRACDALAAGAPASTRFTVTLPRTALDGRTLEGTRTLEFEVFDGERLARRFAPLRLRPPWIAPARWLLAYRGVRDPLGDDDAVPVFEAYRRGVFASPRALSDADEEALRAFEQRVSQLPIESGLSLFQFAAGRDRELADQAFRDGIVLVPIDIVHHAFAVARAVTRTGLLCGARLGEILQQAHDAAAPGEPERVGAVSYTREADPQFFFCARPKFKQTLKRFYVEEPTLDALTAVTEIAERNGWSIEALVRPHQEMAGPRPYLHQRAGRLIEDNEINAALQVLLFGYPLSSHDLRAALGRFAGAAGIRAEELQPTFHHERPEMTEHYMRPTEQAKARLARFLARRTAPPWPPKYPKR